jgi:predicted acylesterase/phospholipase RssA/ABC-type phosphate/phosphonate transport system substrate-binding protein
MAGKASRGLQRGGTLALLTVFLSAVGCIVPAADVRVGFVAFEDFADEWGRYERVFGDLSEASGGALRFRLAAGTYGDVLHWLRQGLVDVAILSPGVAAASLCGDPASATDAIGTYLATKAMPPATSALAASADRVAGVRAGYHAACVVPLGSAIRTAADLRLAVTQGRVQLLFVHPLSVSGHLAPLSALRQLLSPEGLRLALTQAVFTSSHSTSVRLLGETVPGKSRVAFLYDDALAGQPEVEAGLRRVPWPELDGLRIPADAVVARRGYAGAAELAELLLQQRHGDGAPGFLRLAEGAAAYRAVQSWAGTAVAGENAADAQRVSLDEIGWLLLHEARSQRRTPRLALVLSGGGAKCAYQVGAVQAIEEKLAELRRLEPQCGLDIGLVVGTSGGALNALPVALGITATAAGQQSFRDLWRQMDQRELIRPPWRVRANLGLWLACIQIALVGALVRWRIADSARRLRIGAIGLLALALPVVVLSLPSWRPWGLLGPHHVLHHIWLWGSFGMLFAAHCLWVLAVAGLLCAAWGRHSAAVRRLPAACRYLPTFGIAVLPLLQGWTMLLGEESLSDGSGIERALSRKLTALVDGHLDREGLPPRDLGQARTEAERLRAASRQMLQRGLLRRDLVITGSCLSRTAPDLPDDLYFHARATAGSPAPGYGPRGIDLATRPELLLDVALGSSAIFPLFPARVLNDFPRPGERAELIDGGFAHNSPLEAAVLWGATHIILVNPSPERPIESGHLAANLSAAFRHLHQQAQLIDARHHGRAALFTLRPEPNPMCVLDFADTLIAEAVARGYDDARGVRRLGTEQWLGRPRFRKESGEPSHWVLVPPADP